MPVIQQLFGADEFVPQALEVACEKRWIRLAVEFDDASFGARNRVALHIDELVNQPCEFDVTSTVLAM